MLGGFVLMAAKKLGCMLGAAAGREAESRAAAGGTPAEGALRRQSLCLHADMHADMHN